MPEIIDINPVINPEFSGVLRNVLPQTNKALIPSEIDWSVYQATNGAHTNIMTIQTADYKRCVTYGRLQSDVATAAAAWADYMPSLSGGLTTTRLVTGNNTQLFITAKNYTFYIRIRETDGCTIKLTGDFGERTLTTSAETDQFYSSVFTPNTVINWEISKSGYVTATGTKIMPTENEYVSVSRLEPVTTTWTYRLIVNTAASIVKINGSIKTSSSTYGQVFSGTTSSTFISYEVSKSGFNSESGTLTPSYPQKTIALTSGKYIYPVSLVNECSYGLGKETETKPISISYDGVFDDCSLNFLLGFSGGKRIEIGASMPIIYYGTRIDRNFTIDISTHSSLDGSRASYPNAHAPKLYLYVYNRDVYESYIKADEAGAAVLLGSTDTWTTVSASTGTMRATISPDYSPLWNDSGIAFVFKEN